MVITDQDMNFAYNSLPKISKREKAMIKKFTMRTTLQAFENSKKLWIKIITPKAETSRV